MDRNRRRIINLITIIVIIIICVVILTVSFMIKTHIENEIASSTTENPSTPSTPVVEEPPAAPTLPTVNEITEAKFIDLQPTLNRWVKTLGEKEKAGIMIYDLNNSRTAASYRPDEVFNVASLYKLLLAYDGYRQIALGTESPTDIIVTTADKGELSLSECLDLIIRESYNGCADPMHVDQVRSARVNGLIRNWELTNTTDLGLQSTAADITKILRAYWRHSELPQSIWNQLSNSMLIQPATEYDWRQGLPAGFSSQVNVYNKVGWERDAKDKTWLIYADAAILDFVDLGHEYTMVVLTSGLSNTSKIINLAQMVEETVLTNSNNIVK